MESEAEFLLNVLTSLSTREEAQNLLEDLLTPREIDDLRLRMDIARRLYEGQTYEQIQLETRASSTTISRVRRALRRGAGGYLGVLTRLLPDRAQPGR